MGAAGEGALPAGHSLGFLEPPHLGTPPRPPTQPHLHAPASISSRSPRIPPCLVTSLTQGSLCLRLSCPWPAEVVGWSPAQCVLCPSLCPRGAVTSHVPLQALQQHYHPEVSKAASAINQALSEAEVSIAPLLELTAFQVRL